MREHIREIEEQYKQFSKAENTDSKKSYNELKQYIQYMLSFDPNNITNEILSVLRNGVLEKINRFRRSRSNLQTYHSDEFDQLQGDEKLPLNQLIQKIILDKLGPYVTLTKNADGNYVIDKNNSVNQRYGKNLGDLLTALFSSPREFTFDKELIESLMNLQTQTSTDVDESFHPHIYIE